MSMLSIHKQNIDRLERPGLRLIHKNLKIYSLSLTNLERLN